MTNITIRRTAKEASKQAAKIRIFQNLSGNYGRTPPEFSQILLVSVLKLGGRRILSVYGEAAQNVVHF
jgi:hypothetical protein